MKPIRVPSLGSWLFLALGFFAFSAQAQIRIVSFNTLGNPRTGSQTVLAALGDENVNGIAKAPDIFSLQEQSSSTTSGYLSMINGIYGAGTYASTTLFGAGDTTQSFIYNTRTIQLISQQLVGTASSSGMPRQALRADFRPVGYDSTADFYVYGSHFKSSEGTEEAARRNIEAQTLRADANSLGTAQHIIYTGDFNVYRSSESAFSTLTASGNGQAFDPVNRIGTWHDNASFLDVHTQNPRAGSNQGGMDDRFDWQMTTAPFMDGEGLSYITGSYHAFGNSGTHQLNGSVTTGSAAALAARLPGYTTAEATSVLTALESTSDHLPVVADYQLPAKMGATVDQTPGTVIVGATAQVKFSVANTANVVAVNGADELDYTYTAGSGLIGSGNGIDAALGAANQHTLTADTNTAGQHNHTFNVTSSSQSVANGYISQSVSYTVLDHARAAFSPLGATTLELDFGLLDLASGPISLEATLYNLLSTIGYTAGLDFDTISGLGTTDSFQINLLPFQNLTAGSSSNFTVDFLGTTTPGYHRAEYHLTFSDQDLPGAATLAPLSLVFQATVIPEPGTAGLLAFGAFLTLLRKRRAFSGLVDSYWGDDASAAAASVAGTTTSWVSSKPEYPARTRSRP